MEYTDDLRRRKIAHYIAYYTISSSSLFYTAQLVSLWPYLNRLDETADKQFLGYLAATGAIATTIFCPIFGKWTNKLQSWTLPFVLTLACGFINNCIYVLLPFMTPPTMRKWFLFARFMTGMNDVNIGLVRAYIAETTTHAERRRAVSIITASQTIASACGPALQTLLVPLGETGYNYAPAYLKLDMYTSLGWLGIIASVINMAFFSCFRYKSRTERCTTSDENANINNNVYYKSIAWLFIALQFWLVCNYLYLKVLGTSLVMDEFAMTRADALEINSYIVAGGAIVSLIAIITLDPICRWWSETHVMYASFVLMVLARFLMYPMWRSNVVVSESPTDLGCPSWTQPWCRCETQMSMGQYIASNVLDNFGYSWAITLIYTKFSQVLGGKQQGTWMGFITSLSGLARIVSPIVLSFVYVRYGNAITVLLTNFIYIAVVLPTLWMIVYLTRKGEKATCGESTRLTLNALLKGEATSEYL